jgi:hypothetical protein
MNRDRAALISLNGVYDIRQAEAGKMKPRLFQKFAPDGLFGALTRLNGAPRQRPEPSVRQTRRPLVPNLSWPSLFPVLNKR